MKMRSVNHWMEIMLEIGESCVNRIGEMGKDVWEVPLDYRMGYERQQSSKKYDIPNKRQKWL